MPIVVAINLRRQRGETTWRKLFLRRGESRASLLKTISSDRGERGVRKGEILGGEKLVKGKRIRWAVSRTLDGKGLNHRGVR